SDFDCALLADGGVRCWGGTSFGAAVGVLGNGASEASTTPVAVSGISDAVALAVGYNHACTRLASGEIRCWGINDLGQLGDGSQAFSALPSAVPGISGATRIEA